MAFSSSCCGIFRFKPSNSDTHCSSRNSSSNYSESVELRVIREGSWVVDKIGVSQENYQNYTSRYRFFHITIISRVRKITTISVKFCTEVKGRLRYKMAMKYCRKFQLTPLSRALERYRRQTNDRRICDSRPERNVVTFG